MKGNGFALIIVLIFIGILSEMMLSILFFITLEKNTIQNFSIYDRRIHALDIAFEKAFKSMQEGDMQCYRKNCLLKGDFLEAGELLNYAIYYVETIPCFKVKGEIKGGADFFKVIAQITKNADITCAERHFVVPSRKSVVCQGEVKMIDPGWVSWRLIES
jgi:hypothetical protein